MRFPILCWLILSLTATVSCEEAATQATSAPAGSEVQASPSASTPAQLISVAPGEFAQRLESDPQALLLDLRTPEERAAEGILAPPGVARAHIDFASADLSADLQTLEADHIYLYCASGIRSRRVGEMLLGTGPGEVYNLLGGINAWKDAELPVQAAP